MMADDMTWEIIGTTSWSRTFTGKAEVLSRLLAPLARNFEGSNTVSADRFVAENDIVVVEGRNHSTTKRGKPYANRYSWSFRFREGKVVEVVEYCDTQLIVDVLDPLEMP